MLRDFNEDIRVKIPTILTLTRFGYEYISLKDTKWDVETNIFTDIFIESLKKLNPKITDSEIKKPIATMGVELENDDLGRKFYERLVNQSGIYKFTPEVFEVLKKIKKSERGEYELTSAIDILAKQEKMKVKILEKYWLDLGRQEDIPKIEEKINTLF